MSSSVCPFYNLEVPRGQDLDNFWVPVTLGTRLDTRGIMWVLGFSPSAPMTALGEGASPGQGTAGTEGATHTLSPFSLSAST